MFQVIYVELNKSSISNVTRKVQCKNNIKYPLTSYVTKQSLSLRFISLI